MEEEDDEEGEEGRETAAEEAGSPGEDDDGVVGDGDDGEDEEDHQVAQELEAGAELEEVDVHRIAASASSRRRRRREREPAAGPGREQPFPDIASQSFPLSRFPIPDSHSPPTPSRRSSKLEPPKPRPFFIYLFIIIIVISPQLPPQSMTTMTISGALSSKGVNITPDLNFTVCFHVLSLCNSSHHSTPLDKSNF